MLAELVAQDLFAVLLIFVRTGSAFMVLPGLLRGLRLARGSGCCWRS